MPPPAKWTITVRRRSVDANGTGIIEAELLDAGRKEGDLVLSISQGRVLMVEWRAAPGAIGLADFRAWSKEA